MFCQALVACYPDCFGDKRGFFCIVRTGLVNTSLTNIILIYNRGKIVILYYTKETCGMVYFYRSKMVTDLLRRREFLMRKKEVKIG